MNWDYILFDLDGTLTEPKLGITKSFQYALESFGIQEDNLDNLEKVIGPPLYHSFVEYYHFTSEEAWEGVRKYRERFETIGWKENKLFHGIPEMLKQLSDKKLAIASSKPTVFVEKICHYFGIADYFDVLIGSNMDGTNCDKIDIIRLAYEKLGAADKDKVVMVGDRKYDIYGAHEFGIQAIGVNYGYAEEKELEEAGADYIAATVSELEKILKSDVNK